MCGGGVAVAGCGGCGGVLVWPRDGGVVDWREVSGRVEWDPYFRPVPVGMRRTELRERSGGFPGLCVSGTGRYVGGLGNDCRRTGLVERCVVHGGAAPPVVPPEAPEDEGVDEGGASSEPVRKKSWKEVQLEARRRSSPRRVR